MAVAATATIAAVTTAERFGCRLARAECYDASVMKSVAVPLLLVAASGCAQLFGLDETSGKMVEPAGVSLALERWSIGAAVDKNPLDLTDLTASFLVDDGAGGFSRIAGEATAPGEWTAPILDGTPAVMFTVPDVGTPFPRLWQVPARDRRGVFGAFEHPGAQEPLPNSSFTFSATLPSPYVGSETFRIEAIGAWTGRGIPPAQLPDMGITTITATLPYASFGKLTGFPPARITSQDIVVIERYVGNQLTGVFQVPPFDQTDGADPITAAISPVTANQPISATVTPATTMQRFSAVRPAVTGLAQSWTVHACPGWSAGSMTGPRLHGGAVAATDTMITTMYGNPFESLDWRALMQFSTSSSRTYMLAGTTPLTLSAGMYTVAEPSATLAFDLPAGLPINIRANEIPLSTDGMAVALDLTKPVVVDAILDRPDGTVFFVAVYEVAPSADMMTAVRTVVVDAVTTGEPVVTLPPELFVLGHTYFIDFRVMQGGYADAAGGDLATRTLPYSVSRADSAVFQVVAP